MIEDIFDNSEDDSLPYFLGAIVLAPKDESAGDTDRTLILDGQQRLVTLSLIIAALGQKLVEKGDEKTATRTAERALFSYEDETDIPDARLPTKIRLQPGENRITYELLLEDPSKSREKRHKSTRIGKGLVEIYRALEDRVDPTLPEKNQADLYRTMLRKLLRQVEIVKITTPSEGDAFRLFETLNDRGLPLSAADLIKTKLFQQAVSSNRTRELELCKEAWSNVVAATRDDDIVDFLRYYWIATQKLIRKQQLYDHYKKYITTLSPQQAGDMTLQLYLAAGEYEQIVNPRAGLKQEVPEVIDAMERLNVYRARSCRPVLLACSGNVLKHKREPDLPIMTQVCESITVRYLLVGDRNSNLLERIYSEVCQRLREPDLPLLELFSTAPLSDRMAEIPSDEEFKRTLQETEIRNVTPQWRQLLSHLYYVGGARENKSEGPNRVHVEHIFPQNPSAVAFRESGLTNEEEASSLTCRIGNLALLSGEKNRIASNSPFSQKREHYASSDFLLTRRLAADYEKWGQDEIETRSRELANLAVEVYPHPLKIVSGQ